MGGPPAFGHPRVGRTRRTATFVPDGWSPPPIEVGQNPAYRATPTLNLVLYTEKRVLAHETLFRTRFGAVQRGSVNENVAPAPGVLSAQMRPPCISTIMRET